MTADTVELSVVLPVFNEEGSLRPLHAELSPIAASISPDYEIVYVNDGSRDGSAAVLAEIAASDPRVVVFALDRNHGLSSALHAGFNRARGRLIASLDSDLQNDPADLPRLVAELRAGADMACGWRTERDDPWIKRVSSRIANGWRMSRTGSQIHDVTCPLKAFRREVVRVFHPFDGMHRFLPTLAETAGFRVVEIPVGHRPREHGVSKYGVWNRLFRGLSDLRAVKWMMKRTMTYSCARVDAPEADCAAEDA